MRGYVGLADVLVNDKGSGSRQQDWCIGAVNHRCTPWLLCMHIGSASGLLALLRGGCSARPKINRITFHDRRRWRGNAHPMVCTSVPGLLGFRPCARWSGLVDMYPVVMAVMSQNKNNEGFHPF